MQRPRVLDLWELESRLMMSATPVAVMAGAVDPDAIEAAGVSEAVTSVDYFDADADTSDASHAVTSDDTSDGGEPDTGEPVAAVRQLVIIDTSLEDYETLLNDVLATSANDGRILVHILDSSQDGVSQITSLLAQHQDLEAVHFLTHGTEGRVKLGNTWLSSGNLDAYASDVAAWGDALSADGDLLFYGCELAASPAGELFVDALAALSGADVAASTDHTGNARFGANWTFEYTDGVVDAAVVVSAEARDAWQGLLAVINVTTTADVVDGDTSSVAALIASPGSDGFISLREAILAANQNASADDIFLAAGTYTITLAGGGDGGGDLDIKSDLSITGIDAASTFIDGGAIARVFEVHSGIVTMSGLTIQNGSDSDGAGVQVKSGANVLLIDVGITGNTASGKGGGIFNDGTLNLERVAIYGNDANEGGGLYTDGGATSTVVNTTVSGNTATAKGGGISTQAAVTLTNVTIASNTAPTGAGVYVDGGGSVQLKNTILNNNVGGDSNQILTSLGYNIDSDGTALTGAVTGDQAGVDALLGALQDNGGSTMTHALLGGSTAINGGTASGAPALDQRGISRDVLVDIGAYEIPNNTPTTSGIGDVVVNEDAPDSVVDLFAAFADVEDADNQLTYSIAGNTNPGLFDANSINAIAGTLTLDYAADATGSADITIRATDTGGLYVETTFTVTVNPVNDQPTTTGIANVNVSEDAADTVINLFAAFDDIEDLDPALTYTVTGNTNAGLFNSTAINGGAGTLTLDYAAHAYGSANITVRATDTGGLFVETTFTVTVNPVNDQPTTTGIANVNVSEDAADTVINLFAAFDDIEDLDPALTYTITGNTNAGLFNSTAINGGAGTLTLDYAADAYGSANITVRATDTGGLFVETTFSVNVASVNDQPTTVGISDVNVLEDSADTVVDLFAAFNDVEDPDNALTYTIMSNTNPALFSSTLINGITGTLTLDYAPDAYGTADITVRATDTGGLFVDTTFTVDVAPVNDTPITVGIGDITVSEDSADTVIDIFAGFADLEDLNPALTYTIVGNTNTGLFTSTTINAGAGTLTLDYAPNVYGTADITLRATDLGGLFVDTTFTVTVNSVNDQPTTTGITDVTVSEDAADTVIDLFAAFDDIEDLDPLMTYAITGNTNTGLFSSTAINAIGGTLTLDYAPDAFGVANITVRATDTGGLFVETTFTVTVNGVNDQPTTSGIGDVVVNEDAADTVVDLFAAFGDVEDPGSGMTYAVMSNTNPGLFTGVTVNGVAGTLTLDYAPDLFGTSDLTIRATDSGGLFVETSFTVTVNSVNDQPTTAGIGDVTVNEDSADTVLDLFAAFADIEDPDTALVYSITGNTNAGLFASTAIDGGAGTLTLDYAADAYGTADITVRATDTGGLFVETTFTVTVNPVNDQPTTAGIGDVTVSEDSADSVIDLFAAFADIEDPDNLLSYSVLANTNPSLFTSTTVNAGLGTLNLDYAPDAYGSATITVRATDTGGLFVDAVFNVTVTPVNDQPTTSGIGTVTVSEDSADSVIDLFAAFADVEDPDPLMTYTVTSVSNPALFDSTTLDGVAGTLTLDYAANANGTSSITVRATDSAGLFVETTFTVDVTPVNDVPVSADDSYAVTNAGKLVVAPKGVMANDVDVDGDVLTTTLVSGPASGLLVMNPDGSFAYTPDPSFVGTVTFTYQVNDGTVNGNLATVTIKVAAASTTLPTPKIEPPAVEPPATDPEPPATTAEPSADATPPTTAATSAGAPVHGAGDSPQRGPEAPPASPDTTGPAAAQDLGGDELVIEEIAMESPFAISRTTGGFVSRLAFEPVSKMTEIAVDLFAGGVTGMDFATIFSPLMSELDEMRNDLIEATSFENIVAGTAATVTTGFTVGYVMWLVRGGYLLTSLLAQMPAWRLVDPLPILDCLEPLPTGSGDDVDLGSLVQQGMDAVSSDAA